MAPVPEPSSSSRGDAIVETNLTPARLEKMARELKAIQPWEELAR